MSKRDFPTVDELLDSIDLSFTNYKPSKDALHFWNVMQLIKGAKFFSAGIPILHYYFIDLVFGNVKREQLPYSEEINKRVPNTTAQEHLTSQKISNLLSELSPLI